MLKILKALISGGMAGADPAFVRFTSLRRMSSSVLMRILKSRVSDLRIIRLEGPCFYICEQGVKAVK